MNPTLSKIKIIWKSSLQAKCSILILLFWFFIALFADFLAGSIPIISKSSDGLKSPLLKNYLSKANSGQNWKQQNYTWEILPPVPYSPNHIDYNYNKVSNSNHHWLGTYNKGKDLLSGLIHGARWSFIVAVFSTTISFILGMVLGLISGYFGNSKLSTLRMSFVVFIILFPFAIFESFELINWAKDFYELDGISWLLIVISILIGPTVVSIAIANLIGKVIAQKLNYTKRVFVPIDSLIQKIVELKIAIPYLLFIMAFTALFQKPSTLELIFIIGFSGWTGIARFFRAETIKIKALNYVDAAIVSGISKTRILFKHILPNAASPAWTAVSFVFAGTIITEGLLSFLGLVPHGKPSWGQILADARESPSAYWIALFPGMAIFLVLYSIQTLVEKFKKNRFPSDYRNIL